MKFEIKFDTEAKKFFFYIDDVEQDFDDYSITRYSSENSPFKGVFVTYKRKKNDKEECHEIRFDPATGDVTHYEGYTSSMLPTSKDLIEKKTHEDTLDKIFKNKKVKETSMKELIPEPGDSLTKLQPNNLYLPNFKPFSQE